MIGKILFILFAFWVVVSMVVTTVNTALGRPHAPAIIEMGSLIGTLIGCVMLIKFLIQGWPK